MAKKISKNQLERGLVGRGLLAHARLTWDDVGKTWIGCPYTITPEGIEVIA